MVKAQMSQAQFIVWKASIPVWRSFHKAKTDKTRKKYFDILGKMQRIYDYLCGC